LNTSFNETPGSRSREGRPEVLLHPEDATELGLADGDLAEVGNDQGAVRLHVKLFDGLKRGVAISEGLFPNHLFVDGEGINVLTGADQVAPLGGAAFHDGAVWIRPAD
jgi:anaerobic selenocysteine-containing dehydrogenase